MCIYMYGEVSVFQYTLSILQSLPSSGYFLTIFASAFSMTGRLVDIWGSKHLEDTFNLSYCSDCDCDFQSFLSKRVSCINYNY